MGLSPCGQQDLSMFTATLYTGSWALFIKWLRALLAELVPCDGSSPAGDEPPPRPSQAPRDWVIITAAFNWRRLLEIDRRKLIRPVGMDLILKKTCGHMVCEEFKSRAGVRALSLCQSPWVPLKSGALHKKALNLITAVSCLFAFPPESMGSIFECAEL